MDFIDEVKEFLNNQRKEKGEATASTYRSKIYAFYEFVSLELREADVTYIFFLNVMDKNKLLQSVEYYVKAGNLKSRAAVDIYYTVLGNFYKFLSNKYGKTNEYMLITPEEADEIRVYLAIKHEEKMAELEQAIEKSKNNGSGFKLTPVDYFA